MALTRIRRPVGRLVLYAALLLSCHNTVSTATPAAVGRRRAVLVGVDDYSATHLKRQGSWEAPADRAWPTLRGAAGDVDLMSEMLVARYGFKSPDVVTLKNQEATREAILQAMQRHLIDPTAKGDVLVFYFAGHGSQVANSLSTEFDKLDESIIPADSRLGAPDIRDKELAVLFNRMLNRGARLTLIFDSCHSGSVSRDPDVETRGVKPDTRDVHDASEPPAPETRGALVLSASKDFARAFEMTDEEGKTHGAFSWALLKAMRASVAGEAAADTFLRAQAMMRADPPYQDPVMGGDAAARLTPLFSSDAAPATGHDTVAVERVDPDGTVILQGGWAHGLTVGSQLRVREGAAAGTVIRITGMLGIGRSAGRIVTTGTRVSHTALTQGSLLEIATWSAPAGRPLRVWIPQVSDAGAAIALARPLHAEAAKASVRWVDDPKAVMPTHLLRWRGDGWELIGNGDASERIARNATAATIIARVPRHASLFVQLPAASALVEAIGVGPGTDYDSIEPAKHPRGVDYILEGRFDGKSVQYAWVRPVVQKEDEINTPLPPRSDWEPAEPARDAGITLRHTILRLQKILAWHHLESPRDAKSPYRLTLEVAEAGTPVRDATVTGRRRYRLVLRSVDPAPAQIDARYYYVFGIDSFGKSVLLFPRRGSVENHFPIERPGTPPARVIPVGFVNVTKPYGLDTYFLISTDESLPNPSVLESSGVRTRGPRGATPLEELLSRTGGATRSFDALDLSPIWSIDKVLIRSVPPKDEQ